MLLGEYHMKNNAITVSILIKKEEDYFLAHCLEMDIVTTGETYEQVNNDIISLIKAQIEYAFLNDNMDHLFCPAPQEVWEEFYSCTEALEETYPIDPLEKDDTVHRFLPPSFIAKNCFIKSPACYA